MPVLPHGSNMGSDDFNTKELRTMLVLQHGSTMFVLQHGPIVVLGGFDTRELRTMLVLQHGSNMGSDDFNTTEFGCNITGLGCNITTPRV